MNLLVLDENPEGVVFYEIPDDYEDLCKRLDGKYINHDDIDDSDVKLFHSLTGGENKLDKVYSPINLKYYDMLYYVGYLL